MLLFAEELVDGRKVLFGVSRVGKDSIDLVGELEIERTNQRAAFGS